MDYIGSKLKLNKWIFDIIDKEKKDEKIFFDACCGSGIVSQYAVQKGYSIIANDLMSFSSSIVNGSIGLTKPQIKKAHQYIDDINNLNGIDGYFFNNFSDKSLPPRLYFTYQNARKIDAARQYIEQIENLKIKDYLIYCGLEAMSRVSNTTGVQASFLKKFKSRALDNFKIRKEKTFNGKIKIFNLDIFELLNKKYLHTCNNKYILYIDPPYNERQYGPNYHLYETFTKNDHPIAQGITGLRDWVSESKSDFCSRKTCFDFIFKIIEVAKCKKIFISYSSDGILKKEDFKNVFGDKFKYYETANIRYKADTSNKRVYNETDLYEYLFIIEK